MLIFRQGIKLLLTRLVSIGANFVNLEERKPDVVLSGKNQ
jgi:hypothetical protein